MGADGNEPGELGQKVFAAELDEIEKRRQRLVPGGLLDAPRIPGIVLRAMRSIPGK